MNVMKLALLGTAALAAVSVSARADDLADLKAQIEALNGRIASLESAPAVPAGYQLLSISETNTVILPGGENDKFFGTTGTRIGIMPTADVPASTNVVWTGFVSGAIKYRSEFDAGVPGVPAVVGPPAVPAIPAIPAQRRNNIDIMAKAGLNVTGTTDTAVGEVGVSITLLADARTATGGNNRGHDASVATDGFRGWWKITPELELSAGVFGSAAGNGQGYDGKCKCYYAGGFGAALGGFGTSAGGDPAQMRLTYSSGPVSFAIAVEDSDRAGAGRDGFGGAGEIKYAGDAIGFELNAGYWQTPNADEDWTVNAGMNFGLGDVATLSAAVGVGEDAGLAGNADRYVRASLFASFDLSDSVSAEMGVGYNNWKAVNDSIGFAAGIYYTPVSQLTIGLEGAFDSIKNSPDRSRAALVTIYRF